LTDSTASDDWVDRLERAVVRIELASGRLVQAKARAERRYRLASEAGSEALASLDAAIAAQAPRKADAA